MPCVFFINSESYILKYLIMGYGHAHTFDKYFHLYLQQCVLLNTWSGYCTWWVFWRKKFLPILRYLHFIMFRNLLSLLQCTCRKLILLFLLSCPYIVIFVSLDSLYYLILRLHLCGKIHHIPRSWRQKHTSCSVKERLSMERLPKIKW